MEPGEYIPLIIYAVVMIVGGTILTIWLLTGRKTLLRLRKGECIFTGEKFNIVSRKDYGYYEEDREVYKFSVHNGDLISDKKPTVIKGKYVEGKKEYVFESIAFGYTVQRTAEPVRVPATKAFDCDNYIDKTKVTFTILSEGRLSEKQKKRLRRAVEAAKYERQYEIYFYG
jgi:hypothetical protein